METIRFVKYQFKCNGALVDMFFLKFNVESGTTQTEVAEKVGVSLAYVNRITKGREQIVNKTFVKMMDELGYDVELTYKKKAAE